MNAYQKIHHYTFAPSTWLTLRSGVVWVRRDSNNSFSIFERGAPVLSTEKRIWEIAKEIVENRWKMRGPRPKCFICGKRLTDSESVARGIGPECWQHILRRVEAICTGPASNRLQREGRC